MTPREADYCAISTLVAVDRIAAMGLRGWDTELIDQPTVVWSSTFELSAHRLSLTSHTT